jgi:IS1 family transposase
MWGKRRTKYGLFTRITGKAGKSWRMYGGKRDLKTSKKLRKRIQRLGISYDRIGTDEWDSFVSAFAEDNHDTGKNHTVGIEGNKCRMRHRIRRAFRRTCCFSRNLKNHWKAFAMAFFYINYGFV